jgi:hypothetical protein
MTAGFRDGVIPPEMQIAMLAVLALAVAAVYGLVRWIMQAKPKPDPWGPEVEAAIQGPDARPVCHHCFTPQEDPNWFCPECGAAIGPYNNLMPYVNIFSEGEVLRTGVTGHWRTSRLMVLGYLLFSVGAYAIAAPVYWYFLRQNLRRQAALTAEPEPTSETGGI